MPTEAALLLRKTLLFFTFRAAAVHFAVFQVIFKKQPATRTFAGARFMNNRLATGDRTLEYGLAVAAPVFAL
jgi:hypothetical protein